MKLTLLSKVFIALVVIGTAAFIIRHFSSGKTDKGPDAATSAAEDGGKDPAAPPTKRDPKRIVVGVNDFGGAYPGVVANDGATPGPRSRFTAAGLDVEFKLIRGSKERLQAFDDGEVDVMLLSLDYFANLVPIYKDKGVDLKAFLMADWSRGNLGIVAKPTIKSIEGLKDAKIATTRNTPTHYFLINLLKRSNLTAAEIDKIKSNLVFATKTPQAGEMFQRGEVDAVAIWEPHLSQAAAGGKGRVLVSTATASNLIADVLFARTDFLARREADIPRFVHAWFEGVKAIEKDAGASVTTVAQAFKQTDDETRGGARQDQADDLRRQPRVLRHGARGRALRHPLRRRVAGVADRGGHQGGRARRAHPLPEGARGHEQEFAQEQVVEKWAFTGGPKTETTPAAHQERVRVLPHRRRQARRQRQEGGRRLRRGGDPVRQRLRARRGEHRQRGRPRAQRLALPAAAPPRSSSTW